MIKKPIVSGTIQPFRLTMPPIGNYHLSDIEWCVEYFTPKGENILIPKKDAEVVNSDEVIVNVDTSSLGIGELNGILYPTIPDARLPSGLRTFPIPFCTGEIIVGKYDKRNYGLSDY